MGRTDNYISFESSRNRLPRECGVTKLLIHNWVLVGIANMYVLLNASTLLVASVY